MPIRQNGLIPNRPPDTVTATEIANWVYCPEQWLLTAIGRPSANRAVQKAGTAHHSAKATAERVAGGTIAIGRILIVLAILALLTAYLWR